MIEFNREDAERALGRPVQAEPIVTDSVETLTVSVGGEEVSDEPTGAGVIGGVLLGMMSAIASSASSPIPLPPPGMRRLSLGAELLRRLRDEGLDLYDVDNLAAFAECLGLRTIRIEHDEGGEVFEFDTGAWGGEGT